MKRFVLAAIVCSMGTALVLGCADRYPDGQRSSLYYSDKPDTVREAERVDGRAGARKSAPPTGAPASPVPVQ
jgi:hypothetical protein